MKIDIGNLVLTKGESSDLYEITSNVSLKDYKAKIRISNPDITPIEKELKHLPEVKNDDSIYNDESIISYSAKTYNYDGEVNDSSNTETINTRIEIESVTKDKLTETATIKGKVYKIEYVDEVDSSSGEEVIITKEKKTPLENAQVSVSLMSVAKEITRTGKAVSTADGSFTAKVFLGATIKLESGRGFLLKIDSDVTRSLDKGRYYLTMIVSKEEQDGTTSFLKEIIQTKLDINDKN